MAFSIDPEVKSESNIPDEDSIELKMYHTNVPESGSDESNDLRKRRKMFVVAAMVIVGVCLVVVGIIAGLAASGGGKHSGITPSELKALNASLDGVVHELIPNEPNPIKAGHYWNAGMLSEMPKLSVIPKRVSDIQTAIQFAKEHNMQVNMKVHGHSYAGSSAGKGMLVIWMEKYFNKVKVLPGPYKDSCGKVTENVVYVEGGATWLQTYQALGPGWVSPGGTCESVSAAGGWLLGTGFSFEQQRMIGLGPDVVVDFEIVKADGDHIRVDACSDPDLFKSLRGGGGGFATIISVHYPLWPASKVTEYYFGFNRTLHKEPTDPWWDWFVRGSVNADKRWSIWSNNDWDNRGLDRFQFGIWFLGSRQEAEDTPLYQEAHSLWESVPPAARLNGELTEYPNFQNYKISQRIQSAENHRNYKNLNKMTDGGHPMYTGNFKYRPYHGNRLIPRSFLVEQRQEAVKLFKSLEGKHCDNFYHLGGKIAEIGRESPNSTFVNPNLRDAIFQVGMCDEQLLDELRQKFPNSISGNGVNHAGWHERDWQEANWGSRNYKTLLQAKRVHDPENRFWCRHCVGSDMSV